MIFIGDIHGHIEILKEKITAAGFQQQNFIQVGDFGLTGIGGINNELDRLIQLDGFLEAGNNKLFIMRGNHDFKYFWDFRETFPLRNIMLVRDYEVLTIENKNVFFLGGGISINRHYLTPGKDYWPNEIVEFDILKLRGAMLKDVDIVVTHIAPVEAWPSSFSLFAECCIYDETKIGNDLRRELEMEREQMSQVLKYAIESGCKLWYYGHYHKNVETETAKVHFQCIGEGSLFDTVTGNIL